MVRLDRKRADLAGRIRPEDARILDAYYPLGGHVTPDSASAEFDGTAAEKWLRGRLEQMRIIYSKRNTGELIVVPKDDAYPASDLMQSLPMEIIDIASAVLPGWMGRGLVWPTALFDKIGVDVSHLFEKPTWLFEALVRDTPSVASRFNASISQNYSLGVSVRPENVPVLIDLLRKHRSQLICAWKE